MNAANLTVEQHLTEARRYAAKGRRAEDQAFGELGDKVDVAGLDRAESFFSEANAHATIALAMMKADKPGRG